MSTEERPQRRGIRALLRAPFAGFLTPISAEAIGLARLVFGAIVFGNMVEVIPDARAYYSDAGILPRAMIFGGNHPKHFSVFDIAGSASVVVALLIVASIAALAFCVGYRTRLATIACLVFTTSLTARNPNLSDGHDSVIRLMLIIFVFIPMGARYSVDSLIRRARGQAPEEIRWTLPVRLAQFQFAWIYFDAFLQKLTGTPWMNGTAVERALSLVHGMSRPSSATLATMKWFTVPLTVGTMLFEGGFLFLVFCPIATRFMRRFAAVSGVAFHLGTYLTMLVGWFPHTMIALLTMYLDSDWASRPARFVSRLAARPRVATSLKVIGEKYRPLFWLPFIGAEDAAATPTADRTGRFTVPSPEAIVAILPRWTTYAKHARTTFGVGLAATFLASMWASIPDKHAEMLNIETPDAVFNALAEINLIQHWKMFSPGVPSDGWLVARGELADGRKVDVFKGRGTDAIVPMPGLIYSRWTKYIRNIEHTDKKHLRAFGRYLCREWNDSSPDEDQDLDHFRIDFYEQVRTKPGQKAHVKSKRLWTHECQPSRLSASR